MSRVERSRREKVTRYSVRKVSFGAASVAVAAFFMFLGNGAVYAAEPNVTATDSALAATPANNQLDENSGASDSTAPKAQADTTTPTPTDSSSTSVESSTVSKAKADTTTSKPADATPAPVVSSTTSAIEEKSAEKNTEASSAEANSVENKQQTTVKAEEPSTTSVATTKPAEETATTESSKPKLRKKRAADPSSTMDTTSDEAANQVYTAPEDSANVDDLATKLKDLPETVENEKKLDKIDEVGATKNITPGQVSDLNEFGGWKAVNGGKFGVARKTANGVFPIETVNTVRTNGGKDKTWLNESSFDRSNSYALFLGLVRTAATSNERVDDGSLYTQGIENSNKGKGLENYRGIEKTFKNYSLSTGSDVTISFRTGFTGDIDGYKAGYKVEVITKTVDGINNTIYTQSFYPQNFNNNQPTINDENKIVTPVKVGGDAFFETDRSQTENKKDELTKKLEEESNKRRLGTSHGTFTSKKISLAPGVTEYTVRISAADNSKLGMGFQVPWKQYALPVVGNGFAVTQDTSKVAKDLAKKVYDKLTEQKEKDTKWSTPETKAVYEAKLQKIKDALNSDTSTTASYKTVAEDAVAQQKKLNEKEQIKKKANDAVTAKLQEKEAEIENNSKLSPAEKETAKKQAQAEAEKAKQAITNANSQDEVTNKQTEGTTAIGNVNPIGKDKAKEAVDAKLQEKEAEIENNSKLSPAEKETAKKQAQAEAEKAKQAITNANSQDEVTNKQTEGTTAIGNVNPIGKDKAKEAVDAALAEKDKAIDANDKLSDAEKSAAKEEAKKAADEAKKAIDAATDQAGVDAKEAEGKAEIAKVTPAPAVEVGKSAAKAEIEKAAKAKEAAIDANDKLSDAEKAAAKAQVAAEAKKAIEAIEKATTEAEVEAAKEAGKAEIAKVAPATTDYKAKAKAEVEAELAKKLAELENATDLTEAEKAAAKAQVVNKAKEAIEAIQKAATEADVDQAIRNFVYRISAVIREQEEYDLSKLFVNGSVTVKQGESLTDKDVLSKLNLPSGVEIVKVEKPTTSALGTVMAKVTVKLADGSVEEINVPVEVIVSQNHGNEGNGANNTEAKVNKAKLEGAIHQLDELSIKESAKLNAETAKEANALSADAKKVFANADATQAEVDAMVKRIEDFMAKVASSTDHATPATTQAAANASQTVSAQANARKAVKELPNTGTVDSTVAMVAAAASALLGLGLAGRRRKEDEEA